MLMSNSTKMNWVKFLLSTSYMCGGSIPKSVSYQGSVRVGMLPLLGSETVHWNLEQSSCLQSGTKQKEAIWHRWTHSSHFDYEMSFKIQVFSLFAPQWSLSPLSGLWKTSRTTCSQLSAEVFDHHHYKRSQQLGEGSEWAGSELTLNNMTPQFSRSQRKKF